MGGGAPATNAFVGHFEPRKTHLVATKLLFLFICWAKVLHNRRQEMSSEVIVSGRIVLPWLIYEAVCPIRPPRVEGLGKSKRKSHRYWAVGGAVTAAMQYVMRRSASGIRQ